MNTHVQHLPMTRSKTYKLIPTVKTHLVHFTYLFRQKNKDYVPQHYLKSQAEASMVRAYTDFRGM